MSSFLGRLSTPCPKTRGNSGAKPLSFQRQKMVSRLAQKEKFMSTVKTEAGGER
jgi:hypothetical protein